MDWKTHRGFATRPEVGINRQVALAAHEWVEGHLDPAFWQDRDDWVQFFEFTACEAREEKTDAQERGDDARVLYWAYAQLSLGLFLRDRAEKLGVDVKRLLDAYVRLHGTIGIWEPELLILDAAWRPR